MASCGVMANNNGIMASKIENENVAMAKMKMAAESVKKMAMWQYGMACRSKRNNRKQRQWRMAWHQ
jgi:hypothetical protein